MINKVILIGRLTKPLNLNRTSTNKVYSRFTLAVNRRTTNDNQQSSDFINCVAWNKTAEVMYEHLSKGALIGIEGRLNTGSYEKNGEKVYTTDVVVENFHFLESKNKQQSVTYNEPTSKPPVDLAITDEEIPF